MNEELVYLAIPYRWDPEKSFEIANRVAAIMMQHQDVNVFSPISHSHPIALKMVGNMDLDGEFWIKRDEQILKKCDRVIFVRINDEFGDRLIAESEGCQEEMHIARENNIEIEFQDFKCKL
jgi:hypothetical protein